MIPDKLLTTIGKCMKERLYKFIQFTLFLALASLMQACGGSADDSTNYTISANTTSISFANEILKVSDDTYKVDITYNGNGLLVGYAPSSRPVSWLKFRTENLTATSATLFIDVVNVDNIVPNLYDTKVRLSTGDAAKTNLVHHDIDVSLLIWQLTTDKDVISFGGTYGESSIPAQNLSITSESNEWIVTSDVDWLSFDINEGTGDAIIAISPDLSSFTAAQLFEGNVTLTEKTTGDSKVIPVRLGLDPHYLYSHQSAISFTKLANIDATSKTLTISSNSPTAINWQASTDAQWLTLTKAENSSELSVTINTEVDVTDAQNNATITVSALNNDNIIDESVMKETIYVSYYQSTEVSENKVVSDVIVNTDAMVSSPMLPHLYVGEKNLLKIYHQYTAELISTTVISPDETLLEQLIMHPDGNFILAKAVETMTNEDGTTETVTHRYRINLNDLSFSLLEEATIEYEPVQFISFSGRHFVVTQLLEYADENLKRVFWDTDDLYFASLIDQSTISEALYALDNTDASFRRYTAKVNDFIDESIIIEQTHQYRPALLAEDQGIVNFIVDNKEAGIYAISPTSEWISFDGETFTDNGLLPQAENSTSLTLTKSHNNRAFYARFDPTKGFVVDIYNQQQTLINTIVTLGQRPSNIFISNDDRRLIISAKISNQIELINID